MWRCAMLDLSNCLLNGTSRKQVLFPRQSTAIPERSQMKIRPQQMNLMMEVGQLASMINHAPSTQGEGSSAALSSQIPWKTGFTQWLDKKFPENATKHMNCLGDNIDSLQQQVDNLKCELEELRRRLWKRSTAETVVSHEDKCLCGKIPCDLACRNQDEQITQAKFTKWPMTSSPKYAEWSVIHASFICNACLDVHFLTESSGTIMLCNVICDLGSFIWWLTLNLDKTDHPETVVYLVRPV